MRNRLQTLRLNLWSQIIFLTENFRDPASRFLPFAKLKQKHRCGRQKREKAAAKQLFQNAFLPLLGLGKNKMRPRKDCLKDFRKSNRGTSVWVTMIINSIIGFGYLLNLKDPGEWIFPNTYPIR